MTVQIQSDEQVEQAAEDDRGARRAHRQRHLHARRRRRQRSSEAATSRLGRQRRAPAGATAGVRRGAEGRPQRSLPLRQRQEVQALPRQADVVARLELTHGASTCPPTRARAVSCIRVPRRRARRRHGRRAQGRTARTCWSCALRRGTRGGGRVHAQPLLRRAGAAVPRSISQADGAIRALVVNTGNANAGTGDDGLRARAAVCEALASAARLRGRADAAVLDRRDHGAAAGRAHRGRRCRSARRPARRTTGCAAAEAIMTTDTRAEGRLAQGATIGGKTVTVTGIAKGAGMIRPDMATMLGFVATDARDRARRCCSRCCSDVADALVQLHHRRRRYLDQRLLRADRHRHGRPCADRRGSQRRRAALARGACIDVAAAPGAGDRARRRGRDQVRHRAGRAAAATRRGMPAGRLRDRAFAAGQDGVLRLATRTSAASSPRSAMPASPTSTARRSTCTSTTCASPATAAAIPAIAKRTAQRVDEAKPSSRCASVLNRGDAQPTVWTCDLSLRLRENQRRLPLLARRPATRSRRGTTHPTFATCSRRMSAARMRAPSRHPAASAMTKLLDRTRCAALGMPPVALASPAAAAAAGATNGGRIANPAFAIAA